jgi:hypothetical protein
MGVMRNMYNVLVVKPGRKSHLGDLEVDGRILLKWILKILDMRV